MVKIPSSSLIFLHYLFVLGLLISPFVFWPWASVAFEIPKVWFINRWIEVLAIFALFLYPHVVQKSKKDNILLILIILFLLVTFLSSSLGENFQKSFWGNYYRSDGLYTLIHLIILFLFITLNGNSNLVEKGIKSIAFSGIILSIINLVLFTAYYLFGLEFAAFRNWGGAFGGPFGNPNFLSGYLLLTLPLLFAVFKNKKFPLILLTLIVITAILITKAWSGAFGLIIFFICFFLFNNRKKIFIPAILTIVLIFLGIYFYKESPGLNFKTSGAAESRERIFAKGFISFAKKPLTGWGWANFDYAFTTVDWPVKYYNDAYVDKAHSHLLEVLVTTGIIGFTVYVSIILRVFWNLLKLDSPYKTYLLLTFILFLYHSQTNIISISEEIVFWFLAGVSMTKTYLKHRQRPQE